MIVALILLQAAAQAPDIEVGATVRARQVTIERKGEAELVTHAHPDAGSNVQSEAPDAIGKRRLRDVDVRVKGEARIADPLRPTATLDAEASKRPQ